MNEHLSDYQLDAVRLNLASPEVQAHLADCDICQARYAVLTENADAYLSRFSPEGLAAETWMKIDASRSSRKRRWWWPSTALIAAAAAGGLLLARPSEGPVRAKGGGPKVTVFVAPPQKSAQKSAQKGLQKSRLMNGPVDPHAHLRLHVSTETARHVRLLWASEPERWTALFPAADAPAWAIKASTWMPREVVLDGALAPEQLGAVFCRQPIGHVRAAQLLRGAPRDDCSVQTVRVTKS